MTIAEITYDRVRDHTAGHVNEHIDAESRGRLARLAAGSREELVRRIVELDREWNVDRALMANFAILACRYREPCAASRGSHE